MKNFQICGIVGIDQKGSLIYLSIKDSPPITLEQVMRQERSTATVGKIKKAPNPESYRIGKEVKKDYSVEGILKKAVKKEE